MKGSFDVSRGMPGAGSAPPHTLDSVVRRFEAPRPSSAPADDVWTVDVDDPSDPNLWAWAEAAAVTAYFDPMRLAPEGTPSEAARATICLESTPVRLADGHSAWMLGQEVRVRSLERLANRGALQAMRAANAGEPGELLDAVLGAFIAGTQPTRSEMQDVDRLRAMLQTRQWLDRTKLDLPPTAVLRAALERATLLSPFRHLTRGFFAGREVELSRLANYVDGPDDGPGGVPTPPIFVYAAGGMGKSALLAHFILAHAERDTTRPEQWRPFIYLDFDRPELDARDQVGVLVSIARQLGPQVPIVAEQCAAYIRRWSKRRTREERAHAASSRQSKLAESVRAVDVHGATTELAGLLNTAHDAAKSPLVLVLDTLEEVQYATPDAVLPLVQLVLRVRADVPALRPVLAGRIPISTPLPLDSMELPPLPTAAAESLLGNHLPTVLAAKTTLVSRMVRVVGGNPLSLRLAAEVLTREANAELDALGEDELWKRVGDTIVQGQLYERIAGHIHAGPVRQLAIPGLVLRYITAELIEKVLAVPCGVTLDAKVTGSSLFTDLSREVALVRQEGATDRLVVRPELRRTILDNFRRDTTSAETRRKVHEEAIRFYFASDDPASRAEEIYHRLWLGQDTKDIDRRWVNGIESALRSAVDEFDGEAHAYLANRVGGIDDAKLAETMSPPEWEAYAERRASDLLRLGMPGAALEILHLRSERLPT
ncbi:MAG TPA: ATP-binding protein, partial [Gemmatimonadaceae bacterium]|nr:ATP-binding protein [Gemmatimonadaceae bacterium]